ncbi:MAG: recombinase family protein [Bacillota bacterium]
MYNSSECALAYARVSTTQQADADLSLPAQLKAIREFAHKNDITLMQEYIDEGLSAFHDNIRPQFELMIEQASSDPRITSILVHDSTRFSRDKYQSNAVKAKLRKHGVMVIPVSAPYDPSTIDGVWRESIDEALAMTSSMQTAFHVKKGMKENAAKRDPDTGYCYKNGGIPPYGYRLYHVKVGKDSRGKDIIKGLWEIDPEKAPIIYKIIVEWRAGEGLSYKAIRDRLNEQGIPSSKGEHWSTSTIIYMLMENRLLQYAGTYFWNKMPRRTPGKRENDRSEWVEVPDAHPAIITKEEALAALGVTKSRQPRIPAARSYDSKWLLTGNNIENTPFFVCKCCGKSMIGVQFARPRGIGKYICGTAHNRGKVACANTFKIEQPVLENTLLDIIEQNFGAVDSVDMLVNEINNKMKNNVVSHKNVINELQKQLDQVNRNIDHTFDAFTSGLDPELCNERLAKFKEARLDLEKKLKDTQKAQPVQVKINAQRVYDLVCNLKELFENATYEQKRVLIRTFIKRLEFDPESQKINVVMYTKGLEETIKRGDYPRCISGGAGDRDRTGTDQPNPQDFKAHLLEDNKTNPALLFSGKR